MISCLRLRWGRDYQCVVKLFKWLPTAFTIKTKIPRSEKMHDPSSCLTILYSTSYMSATLNSRPPQLLRPFHMLYFFLAGIFFSPYFSIPAYRLLSTNLPSIFRPQCTYSEKTSLAQFSPLV